MMTSYRCAGSHVRRCIKSTVGRRLTDSENQNISNIRLNRDEIISHNSEVVSVHPKLVRSKTATVDETKLVLLARLEEDFMAFFFSCATGVFFGVTVKDAFTVHQGTGRNVGVVCDFFVEHAKSIGMVPVAYKQGLEFVVIVCACGTVDDHGAVSTVGV